MEYDTWKAVKLEWQRGIPTHVECSCLQYMTIHNVLCSGTDWIHNHINPGVPILGQSSDVLKLLLKRFKYIFTIFIYLFEFHVDTFVDGQCSPFSKQIQCKCIITVRQKPLISTFLQRTYKCSERRRAARSIRVLYVDLFVCFFAVLAFLS